MSVSRKNIALTAGENNEGKPCSSTIRTLDFYTHRPATMTNLSDVFQMRVYHFHMTEGGSTVRKATIADVPDAMSDVLSLVRMRCEFICANEYSAPWCFAFRKNVAHFHIVERGTAFLILNRDTPARLGTGDIAILPLSTGHTLASAPGLKPVPIEQAVARGSKREGNVYRIGGGGAETHVVCGQFSFAGVLAPRLLKVLPPLIHITAPQGGPFEWLKLTSHFLIDEARRARPGFVIMVSRLLDLLFVQAVREWGAKSPNNLGWLSGLRDPSVGRALSAIHDEPGRCWTVERLAALAGLSRSAFAARFAEVVGTTPLKYLAG